jgi:hypothetical protein
LPINEIEWRQNLEGANKKRRHRERGLTEYERNHNEG